MPPSSSTTTTSRPATPGSPPRATSGSSRTWAPPTAPTSARSGSPSPPRSRSAPRCGSARRSSSCANDRDGIAVRLTYSAISDVGRVRKDNQDSGYVGPHLVAVCDGVGGAARGDIASSTVIAQLRKLDETMPTPETGESDLLGLVSNALHRAHDRITELV